MVSPGPPHVSARVHLEVTLWSTEAAIGFYDGPKVLGVEAHRAVALTWFVTSFRGVGVVR